jgi:hypothetical protein
MHAVYVLVTTPFTNLLSRPANFNFRLAVRILSR